MSMKNKLLGGAALLMAAFSLNEANATSCAVPPTCAQLGYTMTKADCGDYPVMRCPFALTDDNQIYCEGTVKVVESPILYGDGTVSKKIIPNKTPIGVVFDEVNHLAIALTSVTGDGSAGREAMKWSDNNYNIPNLENCEDVSTIFTCAPDGRVNTNAILACGSGCGGTPAATACNLYQPAGCTKDFCKKGKWFLPSVWEMKNIYLNRGQISKTFTQLNDERFLFGWTSTSFVSLGNWFWSSTEVDHEYAMGFYISSGTERSFSKTSLTYWTEGSYGTVSSGPIIVLPIVKY